MRHIYFYGDSNTYGFDPAGFFDSRYAAGKIWPDIVGSRLAGRWHVTANGLNGRCIPSREAEFAALLKDYSAAVKESGGRFDGRSRRQDGSGGADIFAVMLGSNDYLSMPEPDAVAVAAKMERAVLRIKEMLEGADAPEEYLLIAPPAMYIPAQGGLHAIDTRDGRLSEEYKKAAGRTGCRFLDSASWDVPLSFDGVHFSEEGHAVFAEGIVRYLTGQSSDPCSSERPE